MFKDTGPIDAASILLNLTDYRVITATHDSSGRQVLVEPIATEAACPSCGVLTTRIQARPVHRVKDLPAGGHDLQVRVRKRRKACQEQACERRSFVQTTEQLPFRARITARLSQQLVDEMRCELRAVSRVAAAHSVSWQTVMARLNPVCELVGNVDRMFIRRLGIDEHRFRKVRYARGRTGKVVRIEPWSIVFTDLDTGKILDIVDGRRGAAVKRWLKARPRYWRQRAGRGDRHVFRVPQGRAGHLAQGEDQRGSFPCDCPGESDDHPSAPAPLPRGARAPRQEHGSSVQVPQIIDLQSGEPVDQASEAPEADP